MGCKSAIGHAFQASKLSCVSFVGMNFFLSVITPFSHLFPNKI
jgi:hypothetical protein